MVFTARNCGSPAAGPAAAGDQAFMLGAEVPLSVGGHGCRPRDRAGGEDRRLLVRERQLTQAHELRLTVGGSLNGHDEVAEGGPPPREG